MLPSVPEPTEQRLYMRRSGVGGRAGTNHCLPSTTDAYTLSVVGQDKFDDVKVPDAPVSKANKN